MAEESRPNREGDVVLVYHQEEPSVYARIEGIEPDVKKDWYRITFLLLTIPAQVVTWILRAEYIQGTPFTMGGQPLKIEGVPRVPAPAADLKEDEPPGEGDGSGAKSPAKVIPLHKQRP